MSQSPKYSAPHVLAAIERGSATGPASQSPVAQPKGSAAPRASHVQAAIQQGLGPQQGLGQQQGLGPQPMRPDIGTSSAQPKVVTGRAPVAAHVQAAIARGVSSSTQLKSAESDAGDAPAEVPQAKNTSALHAVSDYVEYVNVKSAGTPPAPPLRPIYALGCSDGDCSIRDIKTGRQRPAGDLFGGFVRMGKGGPIYVSPRAGAGSPGDSHPSIASATPEWQAGGQSVVAAGEVGILSGEIVGHNDKTGHFLSRKNLRQSGLPQEKFHPFTDEAKDWYRK